MTAIRDIIKSGKYRDVLSVTFWVLSFLSPEQKKERRDKWLNEFLHTNLTLPKAKDGDVLFFRSMSRPDYKQLFHTVIEASGCEEPVVAEDYVSGDKSFNGEASDFFVAHLDLCDEIDVEDPVDRLCCFVQLMQYGYVLETYRDIRLKALVCFSDMQPVETLFALYFKRRGVPTVTLQHGLYVDYGDMRTINVINYKVSPSQYFLAWGKDTADLIARNHPRTKVVTCGKPDFYFPKTAINRKVRPFIFVITDQQIFDAQNREMLNLAQSYAIARNLELRVRFHPSNNRVKLKADYPMIKEDLFFIDAECVIGHTSSLLYEAMVLGCRVYRYGTEIPAVPVPESITVRSVEELESKAEQAYPEVLWKAYFDSVGQESQAQYGLFFKQLFGGEHDSMQPGGTSRPSGERVGCIAVPCLPSDLSNIFRMLSIWSDERYAPRRAWHPENPALMILFNNAGPDLLAKTRALISEFPFLEASFSDISVQSAGLEGDRDLYVKERPPQKKGKFGNTAGPNFLFQEVVNRAAVYGGYTFQTELDCFPLVSDWVDHLNRLIARNQGSWVIGPPFSGGSGLHVTMKTHLNGNALYRSGDPGFVGFVNKVWLPRMLELSDRYPNLAYDCWWAMEHHLADSKNGNTSWALLRKYASFIRNEPFIVNLLGGNAFGEAFAEANALYSSVGKPPLFVHSPNAAPAYEKALPVAEADVRAYLSESAAG